MMFIKCAVSSLEGEKGFPGFAFSFVASTQVYSVCTAKADAIV